jgi:hypothetical protein
MHSQTNLLPTLHPLLSENLLRGIAASLGLPVPAQPAPDDPSLSAAAAMLDTYAPRDLYEANQAADAIAARAVYLNACLRALDPALPHALATSLHRTIATLGRMFRNTQTVLTQRQAQPLRPRPDPGNPFPPLHSNNAGGGQAYPPGQVRRDLARQDPMHQSARPAAARGQVPGLRPEDANTQPGNPSPRGNVEATDRTTSDGWQDPMHQFAAWPSAPAQTPGPRSGDADTQVGNPPQPGGVQPSDGLVTGGGQACPADQRQRLAGRLASDPSLRRARTPGSSAQGQAPKTSVRGHAGSGELSCREDPIHQNAARLGPSSIGPQDDGDRGAYLDAIADGEAELPKDPMHQSAAPAGARGQAPGTSALGQASRTSARGHAGAGALLSGEDPNTRTPPGRISPRAGCATTGSWTPILM